MKKLSILGHYAIRYQYSLIQIISFSTCFFKIMCISRIQYVFISFKFADHYSYKETKTNNRKFRKKKLKTTYSCFITHINCHQMCNFLNYMYSCIYIVSLLLSSYFFEYWIVRIRIY